MMKILVAWLFLTTSSAAAIAADASRVPADYLQGLGDARYHLVESETVGRSYHIYVSLPHDYDAASESTYPTVYLLDGGNLFPMLSAYSRYLYLGGETPEVILVGISYGNATFEGGNYRSTDYTAPSAERDYWGGAEKFQGFLSDELVPLIERTYKSEPSRRIVFGQSLGGQFVLYSLLTDPDLFWGHIASNPALHRNLPFFMQQYEKPAANSERPRLFVGDGTLNDERFRAPSREWTAHWQAVANRPWDFKAVDLEGHNHFSPPPDSFRQGMIWLFSGD